MERKAKAEPVRLREWLGTRVVRWSGPQAVVRVKTRADVIVAIPRGLPSHEVLGLACLILNQREYSELREIVAPPDSGSPRQAR